ncbi:MAG: flavodoxin [Clostridia bacterium]|nr:flavodoxin [Lachnospiraceae bacterium]NCC00863.1 flavodoxin [Clostridia bacterium]NCD02093.1 flavodoxin [Clostridia bacterium]
MAKNLIIYYSRKGQNYWNGSIKSLTKGNTEIVAEFIQKAVDGDLFEIETVKSYDADYYKCIDDAQDELRKNARPELKRYLDSIDGYENVFVCGPCWWGTYPMAMFTQLEKLDFTGKKVMAVMTHEGSGLGSSERDLKKICKGAAFGKGLAVHGADAGKSEGTVISWAKKVTVGG